MNEARHGVRSFQCIQCDRCTANCPVHEIDVRYSPRKTILTLLKNGADGFVEGHELWKCLTCLTCLTHLTHLTRLTSLARAARLTSLVR